MPRHKPAAEGGYLRGAETRAKLIESALKLFGERGFEGASTRDISSEAGLNSPALQYYFDNKEGLYRACVEHIIDRVWELLDAPLTVAEQALQNPNATDAQLIDVYLDLLGGFIALIHDSPGATAWRLFLAREQAGLGLQDAEEMMNDRLYCHLGAVTTAIIGRLTGMPADDERTKIRAFAITSQSTVFRVMRRQVLKVLGWDTIGWDRMEQVRGVLLGQTRLMLQALVAERDACRSDLGRERASPGTAYVSSGK